MLPNSDVFFDVFALKVSHVRKTLDTLSSQPPSPHTHLSLLTGDSNATILVVLDRRASFLDQCAVASGCKEGWNSGTTSPDPLC